MKSSRSVILFKKSLFLITIILLSLAIIIGTLEVVARLVSPKTVIHGKVCWEKHKILGWTNCMGKGSVITSEYKADFNINSLGMNDEEIEKSINRAKIRIMALGDSHTFASGVSWDETWPHLLEQMLFGSKVENGTVYNCAVSGYNLGQYLLQMRRLERTLKPDIILIGFSMASDLYDLLPPRLGGFIYGTRFGRVYFDLDENGNLVEIHDLAGKDLIKEPQRIVFTSHTIRSFLENFSLYQRLRRSKLAMWIALHFRLHGRSLWGGFDTVFKKNLDKEDEYRWHLAEEIIKKIAVEAHEKNTKVVLVNIPYLPQVYNEVWKSSFGMFPEKYDRWIAGERLKEICKNSGIYYIDTLYRFIEEVRLKNKWLHYRYDGHPNIEGHKIIAATVMIGLKEYGLVK